jgi:hypothetical protein
LWGRDGTELLFIQPETPDTHQQMMVSDVQTGTAFSHGFPERVIDWPYDRGNEGRTYDIAPDGGRFLTTKDVDQESSEVDTPPPAPTVRVVLHWFEELRERVP